MGPWQTHNHIMLIGDIGKDQDGYFMLLDHHQHHDHSDDNLSTTALSIADLHDAASCLFFDAPGEDVVAEGEEPPLPSIRQVLRRHVLMSMVSGAVSASVELIRHWIHVRRHPLLNHSHNNQETPTPATHQSSWRWLQQRWRRWAGGPVSA